MDRARELLGEVEIVAVVKGQGAEKEGDSEDDMENSNKKRTRVSVRVSNTLQEHCVICNNMDCLQLIFNSSSNYMTKQPIEKEKNLQLKMFLI